MKKSLLVTVLMGMLASTAFGSECKNLPKFEKLKEALTTARNATNGGLNLDMWLTLVNRSGEVCAVTYTGKTVDSQWLGSRVISAQKANAANAFSLKGLALSTANLYSAVQPGGSLFGLQFSNPVDAEKAYDGDTDDYGTKSDDMVGQKIGGVNVFGGGLALYNSNGQVIGAIGVSGDTSCADHNIAWRVRNILKLDYVPAGVSADKNDQIVYDIVSNKSKGGFGHPLCGNNDFLKIVKELPKTRKASIVSK